MLFDYISYLTVCLSLYYVAVSVKQTHI